MAGEIPSRPPKTESLARWKAAVCCLLLAGGVLAVYWPVNSFEFVNFDDPIYVAHNPNVQAGLTWASLGWAWRSTDAANWHPLTWMSHMLDCQLYGMNAGKHHLTSVLLHLANSCLLFLVLRRMTGSLGRSFVVAALFAWHPLRAESVAWVSERKDVLSTFFFLLTLLAYARYAEVVRSQWSVVSSLKSGATRYYALALCFFALGLMSKPMLVTMPFVLLLLDFWPLRRLEVANPKAEIRNPKERRNPRSEEDTVARSPGLPATDHGPRTKELGATRPDSGLRTTDYGLRTTPSLQLLWEKLPFFALALASSAITLWVQRMGHAMPTENALPVEPRFANAIDSYYGYIGKMLWPAHLAVFYIYGHPTLNWTTLLGGVALVAVSVLLLLARRLPNLAVGWFWYLVTLVPAIGLVQVGGQAMADRYTYIPSIGICLLAVFGIGDLAFRLRLGRIVPAALAGALLAAALLATRQQVLCWRNDETLYRHAIAVTSGNFVAYNNLGTALEAQHRYEEAVDCYKQAIHSWPAYADAHCNLANAYVCLKQSSNAVAELQTALKLNPDRPTAHYLLANQLLAAGQPAAAADHYHKALALEPYYAEPHYQLAILSLPRGDFDEAIRQYREALRVKPDWIEALNNLSWLLSTCPDGRYRDATQALILASQVVALTHTNQPGALDTLAAAYAENGQYTNAITSALQALRLAGPSGSLALTNEIAAHLLFYQKKQPFREQPK